MERHSSLGSIASAPTRSTASRIAAGTEGPGVQRAAIWLRFAPDPGARPAPWCRETVNGRLAAHIRVRASPREATRKETRPPRAPLSRQAALLGGPHTRGDHHGATLRQERTGDGVRGATSRARPLTAQRRLKPGVLGGAASPCQAAVFNTACAGLPTLTVESQPSAEPPKPPLRARSGAASTGPSRASSSASWLRASRTARAPGDPGTSLPPAALSADRRFWPYLYPSGTRDRRSWAILEPVDYPKRLRSAAKRPLSRSQGQIRSRGLLSGPPDRPPNPP